MGNHRIENQNELPIVFEKMSTKPRQRFDLRGWKSGGGGLKSLKVVVSLQLNAHHIKMFSDYEQTDIFFLQQKTNITMSFGNFFEFCFFFILLPFDTLFS